MAHTKPPRSPRRALRQWPPDFVALRLRVRSKYLSHRDLHPVEIRAARQDSKNWGYAEKNKRGKPQKRPVRFSTCFLHTFASFVLFVVSSRHWIPACAGMTESLPSPTRFPPRPFASSAVSNPGNLRVNTYVPGGFAAVVYFAAEC
jgi:hypothetical protein